MRQQSEKAPAEVRRSSKPRSSSAAPRGSGRLSRALGNQSYGEVVQARRRKAASSKAERERQSLEAATSLRIEQLRRKDKPVDATDYMLANAKIMAQYVQQILADLDLALPKPRPGWAAESWRQFAIRLVLRLAPGGRRGFLASLERILAPVDLASIVDRGRLIIQKKDDRPVGPLRWYPSVAHEIVAELLPKIQQSLRSIVPQLVESTVEPSGGGGAEATGPKATTPAPSDVTLSHPLDRFVLAALSGGGGRSGHEADAAPPIRPPRKVRLQWLDDDGMDNWARAIDPDATVQDVALTLFNDPDAAYRIVAAPPLFGVKRQDAVLYRDDKAWSDLLVAPSGGLASGRDPTAQVLGSELRDTAILAQAGDAAVGDASRDRVLEHLLSSRHLLALISDQARRFFFHGDGLLSTLSTFSAPLFEGPVEAASARLDERLTRLREAPMPEVAAWQPQVIKQQALLAQVAAGLGQLVRQLEQNKVFNLLQLLAMGAGASKPILATASAYLRAATASDLVATGHQRLEQAQLRHRLMPVESAELLLRDVMARVESVRGAARKHAPRRFRMKNTATFDQLEERYSDLRDRITTIRAQVVTGSPDAGKSLGQVLLEAEKLQFEAEVFSSIVSMGPLLKALYDIKWDSWFVGGNSLARFVGQDIDVEEVEKAGHRLRSRLEGIYKSWSEAQLKLGEIEAMARRSDFYEATLEINNAGDFKARIADAESALRKLGQDRAVVAYLKVAYETLDDAGTRQMVAQVALMIGITLVSMGAGSLATGVVAGARAGALAQLFGMGVESATMSGLQAAIYGDSFSGAFLADFTANLLTFGALRGIRAGIAGTRVDDAQRHLKTAVTMSAKAKGWAAHGLEATAKGAAIAGVQYAQMQADALAKQGRFLSLSELLKEARKGMAMFLGAAIAGRIAQRRIDRIEARGVQVGARWKQRRELKRLAQELEATGDPQLALDVLRRERKLLADELGDLRAALKDPKLRRDRLSDEGQKKLLDEVEAYDRTLGEMELRHLDLEIDLRLEPLVPGKTWVGKNDEVGALLERYRDAGANLSGREMADGSYLHRIEHSGRSIEIMEPRSHARRSPARETPLADGPARTAETVAGTSRDRAGATPEATPAALSAAAPSTLARAVGAPDVRVDAELGSGVRVHATTDPETGNIVITGLRIGPTASLADVLAHRRTVQLLQRYNGGWGRLRKVMDRLWGLAGGHGVIDPTTPQGRAYLEAKKYHQLALARRRKMVQDDTLSDDTREVLRREVDYLESKIPEYEAIAGIRGPGPRSSRIVIGSPDLSRMTAKAGRGNRSDLETSPFDKLNSKIKAAEQKTAEWTELLNETRAAETEANIKVAEVEKAVDAAKDRLATAKEDTRHAEENLAELEKKPEKDPVAIEEAQRRIEMARQAVQEADDLRKKALESRRSAKQQKKDATDEKELYRRAEATYREAELDLKKKKFQLEEDALLDRDWDLSKEVRRLEKTRRTAVRQRGTLGKERRKAQEAADDTRHQERQGNAREVAEALARAKRKYQKKVDEIESLDAKIKRVSTERAKARTEARAKLKAFQEAERMARGANELWKEWRSKSPSKELREWAKDNTTHDPAYGFELKRDDITADHVVSLHEIVRMKDFRTLDRNQQKEIVNLQENIIGMDRGVNSSKVNKSISEWRGHPEHGDIPKQYRDRLLELEAHARKALKDKIQEFVDTNEKKAENKKAKSEKKTENEKKAATTSQFEVRPEPLVPGRARSGDSQDVVDEIRTNLTRQIAGSRGVMQVAYGRLPESIRHRAIPMDQRGTTPLEKGRSLVDAALNARGGMQELLRTLESLGRTFDHIELEGLVGQLTRNPRAPEPQLSTPPLSHEIVSQVLKIARDPQAAFLAWGRLPPDTRAISIAPGGTTPLESAQSLVNASARHPGGLRALHQALEFVFGRTYHAEGLDALVRQWEQSGAPARPKVRAGSEVDAIVKHMADEISRHGDLIDMVYKRLPESVRLHAVPPRQSAVTPMQAARSLIGAAMREHGGLRSLVQAMEFAFGKEDIPTGRLRELTHKVGEPKPSAAEPGRPRSAIDAIVHHMADEISQRRGTVGAAAMRLSESIRSEAMGTVPRTPLEEAESLVRAAAKHEDGLQLLLQGMEFLTGKDIPTERLGALIRAATEGTPTADVPGSRRRSSDGAAPEEHAMTDTGGGARPYVGLSSRDLQREAVNALMTFSDGNRRHRDLRHTAARLIRNGSVRIESRVLSQGVKGRHVGNGEIHLNPEKLKSNTDLIDVVVHEVEHHLQRALGVSTTQWKMLTEWEAFTSGSSASGLPARLLSRIVKTYAERVSKPASKESIDALTQVLEDLEAQEVVMGSRRRKHRHSR